MFVRNLRLKNIRCFKELELNFDTDDKNVRKQTIILGENGTGKSTILRSLALITCGTDSLIELIGEPSSWVRKGTASGSIEAVIQTAQGEIRELLLIIRRADTVTDVITRSVDSLDQLNAALRHSSRSYFVAAYGASRRLSSIKSVHMEPSNFRHVRAQSVATLFDPDAQLNPLESWAMDLDYRDSRSGIKTVRKILSDFLPDLKFERLDKKSRQLFFRSKDGIIPLQQLSDGYQNVAAWVGDLLYRLTTVFEDYKSPLSARGLIIIDEVDLHLHPRWQRNLLSFLKRRLPNFQIIATTHAVVTAQQAGENELYYLKRHGANVQVEAFQNDPSKMLIQQILMTDAFGFASDESLAVERIKDKYRRLRDKSKRTKKDNEELDRLTATVRELTQSTRSNYALHEEQFKVIQKVHTELTRKKK